MNFKKSILSSAVLLPVFLTLTACGGSSGSSSTTDNLPNNEESADPDNTQPEDNSVGPRSYADIDSDDNGLIEITSLEELDWVRNNLAGTYLVDNDGNQYTDGCPAEGCHGYELTTDLDFDTNGDGEVNSADDYFDYDGSGNNEGWLPVGSEATPFIATFNGNDHTIRNLYINRNQQRVGLFGQTGTEGGPAVVRRLSIVDADITNADDYTGILSGYAYDTEVSYIFTSGALNVDEEAGGIIGNIGNSQVSHVGTEADISGYGALGGISSTLVNSELKYSYSDATVYASHGTSAGLVPYVSSSSADQVAFTGTVTSTVTNAAPLFQWMGNNASLSNCYATGAVLSEGTTGFAYTVTGAPAYTISNCYITSDLSAASSVVTEASDDSGFYYATDSTGVDTSSIGTGVTEDELKCPTTADATFEETGCASETLFAGWDEGIWDFGTDQDLPTLRHMTTAYPID